jgi:hypothetical protein
VGIIYISMHGSRIPLINSPLYTQQHFIWELQDIPDNDTPRLCIVTCTHCKNYSKRIPAIKYNSTGNLLSHLRDKHPKIAKEMEIKSQQDNTS